MRLPNIDDLRFLHAFLEANRLGWTREQERLKEKHAQLKRMNQVPDLEEVQKLADATRFIQRVNWWLTWIEDQALKLKRRKARKS